MSDRLMEESDEYHDNCMGCRDQLAARDRRITKGAEIAGAVRLTMDMLVRRRYPSKLQIIELQVALATASAYHHALMTAINQAEIPK